MRPRTVRDVVVEWEEGTPPEPAVRPDTRLVDAIAVIVESGGSRATVLAGGRPVGIVRLEDALRALGLRP